MDPLSVSASLITLLGLAAQTAQHLKKLNKALRGASARVIELQELAADLELTLKELLHKHVEKHPNCPEDSKQFLERAYDRATAKLNQLQNLAIYELTKQDGSGELKVSKMRWLGKHGEAEKLIDELRQIRGDLILAMSMLSS